MSNDDSGYKLTDSPEAIWLEAQCAEEHGQRCWAPNNPWGDECPECGSPCVQYVRKDLYDALLVGAMTTTPTTIQSVSAADMVARLREEGAILEKEEAGFGQTAFAAADLIEKQAAEIERMMPQFVAYEYLESPALRETYQALLEEIVQADADNSGAEPSASVLARAIDKARAALSERREP